MKTIHLMAAMAILYCTASCNLRSEKNAEAYTTTMVAKDLAISAPASDTAATVVWEEQDNSPGERKQEPPQKPVADGNPKETVYPDWNKKLIKTADLRIEAYQYDRFDQRMRSSLERYGAYISTEEQRERFGRLENELTIRVPVSQFDALVDALVKQDSIRIENRQIQASDVTAEMFDTQARVEARKKVRERYLALLQQAHKVHDILEVEQQINSIQEDIEAAAGRLNYLKHQTAYSTIHMYYFTTLQPVDQPNSGDGFLVRALEGFRAGGAFLVDIILLLIRIWPVILGGTLAIIIWKRKRTILVRK